MVAVASAVALEDAVAEPMASTEVSNTPKPTLSTLALSQPLVDCELLLNRVMSPVLPVIVVDARRMALVALLPVLTAPIRFLSLAAVRPLIPVAVTVAVALAVAPEVTSPLVASPLEPKSVASAVALPDAVLLARALPVPDTAPTTVPSWIAPASEVKEP